MTNNQDTITQIQMAEFASGDIKPSPAEVRELARRLLAADAELQERRKPLQDKDLQGVLGALEHPAGINAAGKQVVRSALVELQERRKAAMDSEPVAYTDEEELNFVNDMACMWTKGMGINEVPLYRNAQPAPLTEREPIAWLNDAYLARGVVDGKAGSEDAGPGYIPVYREALPQPAPVVSEIERKAIADKVYGKCCRIPGATFYNAAEFAIDEVEACRAAMLQAEPVKTADRLGNSPLIPDCWCRTCRPLTLNDMRFVVCPDCGNKRCPRANDHRNNCSGSNDPDQEGSAYQAAPQHLRSSPKK